MKISVVTVCYNSQDTIETTIQSVLEQTYSSIEYLVIDGASSDNTMQIVTQYSNNHPNMRVVSEKDAGLYDAMNKAAHMASGEYIIYMNSGDVFNDDIVVEQMIPFLAGGYDMVYGNVIRSKSTGKILEKYSGPFKEMRLLLSGKIMCHQSMFTRTTLMKEYSFDTEYSITADYDFVMRLMHDKRRVYYAKDIIVSRVDNIEGISSQLSNMDEMRRQDDRSLRTNFPVLYYMICPIKTIIRVVKRIQEHNMLKK